MRAIQSWYGLSLGEEKPRGRSECWSMSAHGLRVDSISSHGPPPRPRCGGAWVNCSPQRGWGFAQSWFGLGRFLFPSPSEGCFQTTNRAWGEEAQFDTFEPWWSRYRFRFRGIVGWGCATQESLSEPFRAGHRIAVSWNGVFCVRPVNRNIKLWIYNWTLLSLLIL